MTETQTLTLTDFLLARIAEDEAVAREVAEKVGSGRYYEDAEGVEPSAYFDRDYQQGGYTITAARVLAECEAKRRIVAAHSYTEDGRHSCAHPTGARGQWNYYEWESCATLAALTLPYADHPDYDEGWKP